MAALALKISKFLIIFQVMEPQNALTHEPSHCTSHQDDIQDDIFPSISSVYHMYIILVVILRNSQMVLFHFKVAETFQWAIFAFQSHKKSIFFSVEQQKSAKGSLLTLK